MFSCVYAVVYLTFQLFESIRTGKLFIPATVINIGFVPPIFRVLYLNVVFFFWSIYLSLVLNKDEEA